MESRYIALRFRCPIDSEDALQGYMLTRFSVEGIEESDDGSVQYFVPRQEWTEEAKQALADFTREAGDVELLGSGLVEERDWNAEWEAGIEPLRITENLVVTPSWKMEEARAMGSRYVITIDPKMSFGTGHHETTRLCLVSIDALDVREKTVLDVGTGTGVLAIYALMRSAANAVGIDTDPWSIENVQENRELNGFSHFQFEVREGTLEQTVQEHERFDLILANIHRNVLLDIAPSIRQHAKPYAYVVLSGLLIYDVDEVLKAYQEVGFELVADRRENEWASLTLRL